MKEVEFSINGKKIKASRKETILSVAEKEGIEIPALCFHPDLEIKASCRICVVEVEGKKDLLPACSSFIEQGMKIKTDSTKVKRARKINLELIFAQHCEECHDCIWRFNCQLLDLARKYKVQINRFTDRKKDYPIYRFGSCLEFDSSKCIDCRNCIEVCGNQGVNYLELRREQDFLEVVPSEDEKKDCVYCGQCIVHCPVGAFESVGEFEKIEKPFSFKGKKIIAQIAPALRVSIGEEFGFSPGTFMLENLTGSLKQLGADKVFDVCVGADFTTIEEAKEFLKRIAEKKNLPMMTSCCPSWVKFIEFYYPEFIPNFTSVRSPHIILGGLIKTYWAEKEKLKPEDIIVVSIMPCISKKHEIEKKELEITVGTTGKKQKIKPVDYVLTTREIARLIKKKKIDFKKMKGQYPDNPFGEPSGSGVIYGASGGVMESALRMVFKEIEGKNNPVKFKRGEKKDGIRKLEIRIGNKRIKVAIVSGLGNAKKLLEEIKTYPKRYDYIEVMACPGGCIGGGGQPVPNNSEIEKERAKKLFSLDSSSLQRLPDENPSVKKIYRDFLNKDSLIEKICHTKYKKAKKEKYEKFN